MNKSFRLLTGLALAVCCLAACHKTDPPGGGGGSTVPDIEKGEHLADITYQVNVYSFADSNGDGWGDLRGVKQHLDYFESLGVSALWLSPIQPSMSYHGYDVTDYFTINPKLGTEADFQSLIEEAKVRGIDIYMDYVLNHSGSDNPWFQAALADPASPYRDYYVFSDNPTADVAAGKIDNFDGAKSPGMGNWYKTSDGSYYFASFDKSMPDFNYGPSRNCTESAAFQDLAASADKWINMGVAGMRLDAVRWIYQDQELANVFFLHYWYEHCASTSRAAGHGGFFMVGEAWCDNAEQMAPYFSAIPSCFNFYYYWTLKDRIIRGKGDDFAKTVLYFRGLFRPCNPGFIDAIKLSNHDEDRAASDLGKDINKEKLAAAVLLTSPGKPFIYQGEELGYWGTKSKGDEYVRTPIKWTKGGSVPSIALHGKVDNAMLTPDISVEAQSNDKSSLLSLYRKFAEARNTYKALAKGEMKEVSSPNEEVAIWTMSYENQSVLVIHNFSGSTASAILPAKYAVSNATDLVSNGSYTIKGSTVAMGPYSSVVFAL